MKQELPVNIDAERFILGSVLLDDVAYGTASAELSLDDFSLEKHRRIFRRMGQIYDRGEKIDAVTLYEELRRHNEAEACDGLSYLVSLDEGLPRVPNVESYCRILREKAARRRIIHTAEHLAQRAATAGEDLQEIIAAGQDLFTEIGAVRRQGFHSINDLPSVYECGAREVEYILEPELPKGALVALTGDSGSGKSTLMTAWARDAGVPVLFLDRENPASVIAERLRRLNVQDDGPNLRFWGGWLAEEAPQPDAAVVVDWVKACDPKPLIVVDSLAAFHGGDQNDAGEMRSFMHRCRRLADLGATVVVIHHDGKAETAKDYRGSSDFKAAIDQGFHVSNFGADGHLDRLVLRPFKSRYGLAGELVYSYAGGLFVKGDCHDARETVSERLTELLRLNPGVTSRKFDELANGIGRNVGRRFLADGVLSGAVRRESGVRNQQRHYLVGSDE